MHIVFTQIHIFSPPGKKLCTCTQIMCKLHKSWLTRGPHQPSMQIANHIYIFFLPTIVPHALPFTVYYPYHQTGWSVLEKIQKIPVTGEQNRIGMKCNL